MKEESVVILANGAFPRKGSVPYGILAAAATVVCCDGAADTYRRRFRRLPTVVVGDCDSVKGRYPEMVRIPDQETNDLEKAIAYCRQRGWRTPVIVGATGKREDHTLGNIFRALAAQLTIVTEEGCFVPVAARAALTVDVGAAVSVFATDPATRMTSRGLAWPLDGVSFSSLFCATLNRATARRLLLTTTRPVSVFCAHPRREVGA
jgi:thiamine pyrophosphokinase